MHVISDSTIRNMAESLIDVDGVIGVVLGGSRARRTHLPTSDVDLGIYYLETFDRPALSRLIARWTGQPGEVGVPGSWGPWVDAGAWLNVDRTPVDWIMRDLNRVEEQCVRARQGQFAFHQQPGHPLGFLDVAYVGELATSQILADPSGRLVRLQGEFRDVPTPLRMAICESLWEAIFLVDSVRKSVARSDTNYVALSLARALMLCAHALHANEGVWVTNEKGLIPAVASLQAAPRAFAARAANAMSNIGTSQVMQARAIELVSQLLNETEFLLKNGQGGVPSGTPIATSYNLEADRELR